MGSFCLGRQNSCFGYKSGLQSKAAILILTFFRLSYVSQISVDFISYICNSSALRLLMNCFRFYANFFLPKLELNSTLISRVKEISVFRVKITVVTCNSWARSWIVLVWNKFQKDALSQLASSKHIQEEYTLHAAVKSFAVINASDSEWDKERILRKHIIS